MNYIKKYQYWLSLAILLVLAFLLYSQTLNHDFTNLDDNLQVTDNTDIRTLDFPHLKKIFTSQYVGMYQPVTTLSYALEYQLYKLDPGKYFLTSILLHLINILLVFIFINKLTTSRNKALIVALLFALHPLYAEAVCWISARSTLLYSLFYLLSLIFYLKYKKNRKSGAYVLSLVFFLLSVFSKAMAVTLPVILILTDYFTEKQFKWKSLINKIPCFFISLAFGIIAFNSSNYYFGFPERLVISFYQTDWYIIMSVIPFDISPYYPDPAALNMFYYLATIPLVAIAFILYYLKKYRRILIFALMFLLISLGLVLKLFVFFDQNVAGRYTYLAYLGMFLMFAYFIDSVKNKTIKYIIPLIFAAFFSIRTYSHISDYQNSFVLWEKVLDKYPDSYVALINMADAYKQNNDNEKALYYAEKGLNIKETAKGLAIRGYLLSRTKRTDDALNDYNNALQLDSLYLPAYINRGNLFIYLGNYPKALADYNTAIKLYPKKAEPYFNRGIAYDLSNKINSAINDYSQAITINPDFVQALKNRGIDYLVTREYSNALSDINHAVNLQPDDGSLYMIRAEIFISTQAMDNACNDFYSAKKYGIREASEQIKQYCNP